MGYTEKYVSALDAACKKAENDYNHETEFAAVVADAFRAGMTFQYKNGFIMFADDLLESELPKNGQLYIVISTSNRAYLCRCVVTTSENGRYNFSYNGQNGTTYYTFNIIGGSMLMENIGAWQRFIINKK